ncbi:hypothetical protein KUBF_29640 [Bacteroides finegoldii]|nr:hypothetical protein KUBF_29640 [Bacteroides finegoldii]
MTLDVSANYVKQNDRNMVNQGTYSNPLVTAYLFPRGDDWNDIKMYERYDTTRKSILNIGHKIFRLNRAKPLLDCLSQLTRNG